MRGCGKGIDPIPAHKCAVAKGPCARHPQHVVLKCNRQDSAPSSTAIRSMPPESRHIKQLKVEYIKQPQKGFLTWIIGGWLTCSKISHHTQTETASLTLSTSCVRLWHAFRIPQLMCKLGEKLRITSLRREIAQMSSTVSVLLRSGQSKIRRRNFTAQTYKQERLAQWVMLQRTSQAVCGN